MNAFQDANPAWATLASLVQDMQGDRLLRLHFPHNDAPADATRLNQEKIVMATQE